jgi:polysaccharide pyruvyl transferase CsaB
VSGGGSLLQDVTSARSLLYYLGLILMARALRRPVVVLAQGIGPLRRPALRRLTARALQGVARITVRDADSAAELRGMGVGSGGHPEILVTADPVFALAPAPPERGQALLAGIPGPRPWVGVSVRPWPGIDALLPSLGGALTQIEGAGGTPVFLPLQPAADRPLCCSLAERVGRGVVWPGALQPAEWLAVVSALDLVVAMRLHALIFAAVSGVPCLGLSYDPKVTRLLARLERSSAGEVAAFDPAAFSRRLAAALRDPASERPAPERVELLRQAARRNAEVALAVAR